MDARRVEVERTDSGYEARVFTRIDNPEETQPSVTIGADAIEIDGVPISVESSAVIAEEGENVGVNVKRQSRMQGGGVRLLEITTPKGIEADAARLTERGGP